MFYFVVLLVGVIVGSALRQPKAESQPPAGLGDFQAPTAEEGREIPVLFGTRDIKAPNVVWFGNLRSVAIRKKGGKK